MTGHSDDARDRYARARDADEPGAHSGAESQARERKIPGTASAEEGYQPGRGTAAGEPLKMREAQEEDADAQERNETRQDR
ncbi:hypothetical protein [Streptomyces sp. NPDC048521]|uniref:hypothetical protein n=1 Tax=Streptomyces sp. NPDC048521 TaxID=3365566 RepID=UPI00370FBC20